MKDIVRVYRGGQASLGVKAERDGYIGECERMYDFYTMVIIKPGTSARNTIKSLEITIKDLEMRAEAEEKE